MDEEQIRELGRSAKRAAWHCALIALAFLVLFLLTARKAHNL